MLVMLVLGALTVCGCSERMSPDTDHALLSLEDVLKKNIGGVSFGVEHPPGNCQRLLTVNDSPLLSILGTELEDALPVEPPEHWSSDRYVIEFENRAGKRSQHALWFQWHTDHGPGYLEMRKGWYEVSPRFCFLVKNLSDYSGALVE